MSEPFRFCRCGYVVMLLTAVGHGKLWCARCPRRLQKGERL